MINFCTTPLTGDYTFYYEGDPAFDRESEAFNYDLWRDTGDEQHLPCRPGEKPTRFKMRRLPADAMAFISDIAGGDGGGSAQAALWAIRLAVREVEHCDDGLPPVEIVTRYGHKALCDDWARIIQAVDGGRLYAAMVDRVTEDMHGSPRD